MTYRYMGVGLLSVLLVSCVGQSAVEEDSDSSSEVFSESRAEVERAPVSRTVIVPAGTVFHVMLIESIGTESNEAGDVFLARLTQPVSVDGEAVFAEGTTVRGRIHAVEGSGRIRGRAHIELGLTDVLVDGQTGIPISTQSFSETAESDTGRDAAIGAAGGTVGAVIGGLTGGKTGAVIGGAAGAAGSVMATKGQELSYPPETPLSFTMDRSLELSLDRS